MDKDTAIKALAAIEAKDDAALTELGITVYGNKGRLWTNTACITNLDAVKGECNPRLAFNYCTTEHIGCPDCMAALKLAAVCDTEDEERSVGMPAHLAAPTVTNMELYILYSCDAWHTPGSLALMGVFSCKYELLRAVREKLHNTEDQAAITDEQVGNLERMGQTQGLEYAGYDELIIEECVLNQL